MKNVNKSSRITVRFTYKEHKKIINKADKLGISISDYIRNIVLCDNPISNNTTDIKNIEIITLGIELARYIEKNYSSYMKDDIGLKERSDELWKKLS